MTNQNDKNDKNAQANSPRINERIRTPEVRVVDPEGAQLGVMPVEEALERAAAFQLDLVEVAPQAKPPVCRIMDYGKYKYQQKKRANDARKKSTKIERKEIKMRPKTDEHDFMTKLRQARGFLGEHHKVKLTVMFRGREITHPELAQEMLERAGRELADIADIEQSPKLEGRNMTMGFTPKITHAAAAANQQAQAPAQTPNS
jgi:translation initiation factor IF-3